MITRKRVTWIAVIAATLIIFPKVIGYPLTLAAITAVIVFHEFGHWVPARAVGIGVSEFSIGFGTLLYTFPKKLWGTTFVIRAVPLGGYIKPVEAEMNEAAIWKRALFLAGGPLMNIFLAAALIFTVYANFGEPHPVIASTSVYALDTQLTAAKDAGMMPEDVIQSVDGKAVVTPQDVIDAVKASETGSITFVVKRGETEKSLVVHRDTTGRVGIARFMVTKKNQYTPVESSSAAIDAVEETASQSWSMLVVYGKLLHIIPKSQDEQLSVDSMQSIVGIVQGGSEELTAGMAAFLMYCAIVSIALGVVNFLPFPGLDGGHLLFLAIEKKRGKPISPILQAKLIIGTYALLIILALYVTYNDIARMVGPTWATPVMVLFICLLVRYLVPVVWWSKLRKS